jgi:Ca-activated chloride channel family protein
VTLVAPDYLWLLSAVIAAVALEMFSAGRSRRATARFASPAMLPVVAPQRSGPRRLLVSAGVVLSMTVLTIAAARPARAVQVPRVLSTVMVALDCSASMSSSDVPPSRLEVAAREAEDFVRALPGAPLVGYVSFSSAASIDVPPTYDREAVLSAIADTHVLGGTAIGEAIVSSLNAISFTVGLPAVDEPHARTRVFLPPSAIVLLSDGANNAGRPVGVADALAKRFGVPVSTIAYGTPDGTAIINGEKESVSVDAQALKDIAQTTGGSYFRATSAVQLADIYRQLRTKIGYRTQLDDITSWFLAAAILIALATAAASLAWFTRIP